MFLKKQNLGNVILTRYVLCFSVGDFSEQIVVMKR